MKVNSIANLFTSVIFFVVTGFSNVGFGAETLGKDGSPAGAVAPESQVEESKEDCEGRIKQPCKDKADIENSKDSSKLAGAYEVCNQKATESCKHKKSKSEIDKSADNCKDAYKEFKDVKDDATRACEGIVNPADTTKQNSIDTILTSSKSSSFSKSIDLKKSCSEQISECKRIMSETNSNSLMSGSNPDSLSQLTNTFLSVKNPDYYKQLQEMDTQQAQTVGKLASCIKYKSKETKENKKDIETRRKEIKEKMKSLNDEIKKSEKEMNDKNSEYRKAIQKLDKDYNETVRKADADIRNKSTQSQQALVKAGKEIRDLNSRIVQAQVKLNRIKFDFANQQLTDTAEKMNMLCSTVYETAQRCMVASAKNKYPDDLKAEKCAEFPKLTTKRGAKATAELNSKLKYVNDLCYQNENLRKKNEAQKQLENENAVNRELSELQASLQDAQRQQNIANQDTQSVQSETEREKTEAKLAKDQESGVLQTNNQEFILTEQKHQAEIQVKIKEAQDELNQLELEAKTGEESPVGEASAAVQKGIDKAVSAANICKCGKTQLKDDGEYQIAPEAGPNKDICQNIQREFLDNSQSAKAARRKKDRAGK